MIAEIGHFALVLAFVLSLVQSTIPHYGAVKRHTGMMAVAVASAFGAIGIWMALRTGSAEAVQGVFPLLFVLFFLSSISLPRDLIAQDWFRSIADWNPVSYMVEGLRSLVISGWDAEALWKGFLITGLIFLIAILASGRALRTRMERT